MEKTGKCDEPELDNTCSGFVQLVGGLSIKDFLEKHNTEFTITPKDDDFEVTKESMVENVYSFNEYEPYINMECVGENLAENDPSGSPFEQIAERMTNITQDGGVKKLIIKSGSGSVIPHDAVAYVHYSFHLEMQEIPFDSSSMRNGPDNPMRFQLGTGQVFLGVEIAVGSMKAGEKSQFLISPEYAFGKLGAPPRIPEDSSILAEIDLIKFVDCGSALATDLDVIDRQEAKDFEHVAKVATGFNAAAKDHYNNKNVGGAIRMYRRAEKVLLNCQLKNDEEEEKQKKLLLKVYTNLAVCYNDPKMRKHEKVCIAVTDAFNVTPELAKSSPRLLYNHGKALSSLGEYKRAIERLKTAYRLAPNSDEIAAMLVKVEGKYKKYKEDEKIFFKKAFKDGNANPPKKDHSDEENEIVEDISDSLKNLITDELTNFAASKISRLQLPKLTEGEMVATRRIARSLNLKCSTVTVDNETRFYITK